MADTKQSTTETEGGDEWFKTTHWSVVLSLSDSDSAQASAALAKLCETYWRPLYAYIRQSGRGREDAADLTQEFFALVIEKEYLKGVVPEKAKFRSFLLMALKRFMANEWARANRHKRGGGRGTISLDEASAEGNYLIEPMDNGLSPDQLFARRWAQTLLEQALNRLQAEYVAGGNAALFEQLKDLQPSEHGLLSYVELASRLGMTESAFRSAVHRFRQRHRQILRQEIAHTVLRPEEIDEEIRFLITVVGR